MKRRDGFTLIEILVVVTILGILATLVVTRVFGRVTDARIQAAKIDIRTIDSALSLYRLDNYRYPSTEIGLRALIERPPKTEAPNWKEGLYIKKLPVDPWGNPYLYRYDEIQPDIYTLGADAKPGGVGEAADIHWSGL